MPMPKRRIPLFLAAASTVLLAAAVVTPLHPRSARDAASYQKRKPAAKAAPAPDLPLEAILDRAAAYCAKLESSAFDFVCREEITESLDPSLDVGLQRIGAAVVTEVPGSTRYSGPTLIIRNVRKIKHTYVYDYQCVRAGRTIREVRTQLKEDGKRKVVPNADLATSVVVFGNALARTRSASSANASARATISRSPARTRSARSGSWSSTPCPGRARPPTRNLYGKAWVDPKTGDILRIEWSENRVGHYDIFEERGKKFRRTPRLVIRSDFSAEKNGIRFPSRLYVEEAYLKDKGKAFVRSKTEVVYKDFKFFSVEYDVR